MHWREILRRPIRTEKSEIARATGQYTFVVDARANKYQIANAVERAWPKVKVDKIRVINVAPKRARRLRTTINRKPAYKKAIITLAQGSIELFEGA